MIEIKKGLVIYKVDYLDKYANNCVVGYWLHHDDAVKAAEDYNKNELDEMALLEARVMPIAVN